MNTPNTDKANDRIKDAVKRLEGAVDDVVALAGNRAAHYLENTADRLKGGARERERERSWPREPAWLWSDKPRTRSLYRDAKDGKIFGVCAGIANYYGIERWVVRSLAVVALILFHWVVFVAYLVAALVLDNEPKESARTRKSGGARHRARADHRPPKRARAGHGQPKREEVAISPSRRLRHVHADLDQVELRLRRIETHITSGQYELQRELAKIGNAT